MTRAVSLRARALPMGLALGLALGIGLGLAPELALLTPAMPAAVALAQAPGAGGPEPLYLSAVLEEAAVCGPGFASANFAGQAFRLELKARQAQASLRPIIGARQDLHPEPRTQPALRIEWDFLEYITLSANLPESVTVDYTRPLWPPEDRSLRRAIEAMDLSVKELEHEHALVSAYRAVVDAFHALAKARADAALATEALALARERAAAAGERYAAGQIGVREWQEAQEAQRQEEVAWHKAQSAVVQAETRLVRLVWGACRPGLDGSVLAGRELIDDLAWEPFIARIGAALAEPETAWLDRVLEMDLAYQQAVLAQMQQEQALAEAERARRFSVSASASVTVPVSGPSAGKPNYSASLSANLDLSRLAVIQEQQAALTLASASVRTEQARLDALDAVTGARMAVRDAQFALDVADRGARQAAENLDVVRRRWEAGFASPLDVAEAELAAARAKVTLAKAEADLHLAWLALGVLLGVPLP